MRLYYRPEKGWINRPRRQKLCYITSYVWGYWLLTIPTKEGRANAKEKKANKSHLMNK